MSATLFDADPYNDDTAAKPAMSAERRRTLRRQQLLDAGVHPTTRRPLIDAEWRLTCGDCDRLRRHRSGPGRTFWKCSAVAITFGPATDVRVSWPACDRVVVS